MKKKAFDKLVGSVKEGGAILRGEMSPARTFEYSHLKAQTLNQERNQSQALEVTSKEHRKLLKAS